MLMYKIIICSRLQTFFIHYIYLKKYGKLSYFDKNSSKHNEHYVKFNDKEYSKCDERSHTSQDVLISEFKHIVKPLYTNDNVLEHMKNVKDNTEHYNYIVRMQRFQGHGQISNSADFYTLISKNVFE